MCGTWHVRGGYFIDSNITCQGRTLHWQQHDMADCVLSVHNQPQPLNEVMLPWLADIYQNIYSMHLRDIESVPTLVCMLATDTVTHSCMHLCLPG